ncbi:MAG TPA: hypothetical protein VFN89_06895 [Solirubrobacterales bacterium]|nr:hypothetical protein [Solirubrobacterales bacterium]
MRRVLGISALAAWAALLGAASASAAPTPGPAWEIIPQANTTIAPGDSGNYLVQIQNVGNVVADGGSDPTIFTATLPGGLKATGAEPLLTPAKHAWDCLSNIYPTSAITCTDASDVFNPEDDSILKVTVAASPAIPPEAVKTAVFEVSGGGAPTASSSFPIIARATPPGFGLASFDGRTVADAGGTPSTKAGAHPYDSSVSFDLNTVHHGGDFYGDLWPVEPAKDIFAELPPGLIGSPTAASQCNIDQLSNNSSGSFSPEPLCAPSSQIGTARVRANTGQQLEYDSVGPLPVFNMAPPTGVPARFGFNVLGTSILLDAHLRSDGDYGFTIADRNVPEGLPIAGSTVTLWGTPASTAHDQERVCIGGSGHCPAGLSEKPFLRNPTSCRTPEEMRTSMSVDSWFHSGRLTSTDQPDLSDPAWSTRSYLPHEAPDYPYPPQNWGAPVGISECDKVPVKGSLTATPTAEDVESPTGLGVNLSIPNPGMESPSATASSDVKEVKVTLPEGVTINPSQAEGLGVCRPDQYSSEEASFHPVEGHGCPSDSKIGSITLHTQLLDEPLSGEVFVAQPDDPRTTEHGAENPFDSLLALYLIVKDPERGVLVKLAGEVQPDPTTGRITATFRDLPQLPFESFEFRFREGARAPLVTPSTCGTYTTEAEITPWSDPEHPFISRSPWQVLHGIGGGPCPPQGIPPFDPTFQAGAINPNAGSFSPFDMRLIRQDGEQDMTKFSAVLPPGELGSLAGVAKCPDSAIAVARAKTGEEELASPSCPANSLIGHTLAGAGVGSVLTYVKGQVYLGGPYHGDPLSVIAITPAVAGPFDAGTVVVQAALTLNPKTAEVEVDGAKSEPIPHILKGIVLKVRDLRVHVDRPNFTLNPTSCDELSARSVLFGSYLNVLDPSDDRPVDLSTRYQAANCLNLGFKPDLRLDLQGGTRRGDHPALKAIYTPRKGDANIKGLVVRLPRSAFLDQAHIKTICTRMQFAAGAGDGAECPKASRYGFVKAWTPLLDEPLEGPVFLRSSNHKLPDLVFALHGLVGIEVDVRIDSQKGGIRASLEEAPDAPLSKVVLHMQGAKKGLIINSKDLCAGRTDRASLLATGHNGKQSSSKPVMRPVSCGGKRKHRQG